LRAEIEKLSLRDAVIRIAEDQMHSAIASQSNGFGVYNIADDLNWCGAFAYWCWEQACAIKRESNPFGPKSTVLWSPQRAISYAMRDDTPVQLLRYAGEDPMTGKGKQEYREIGWAGCNLERADVVLYREGTASGWKHVCLVYEPSDSGSIRSIDGNQGQNDCIKIRTRSLDAKVAGGAPSLVFVHVGNAAGIS
jgi:hypothetical protein